MNLTQKILCYQRGYWGLSNILLEIRGICHQMLGTRKDWSPAEIDEFYQDIRPKLIRAINRFQFRQHGFENYLRRLIHYQERSFRQRRKTDELQDSILAEFSSEAYQVVGTGISRLFGCSDDEWPESQRPDSLMDDEVLESPPGRDCLPLDLSEPSTLPPTQKRLLLLALQRSEALDDDAINRLSKATSLPPLQLLGFRQELVELIERKSRRRRLLQDRRNAKLIQLKKVGDDPVSRARLEESIQASNRMLAKLHTRPSHQELSRVTGIPKGTIDSTLYKLGKQLE